MRRSNYLLRHSWLPARLRGTLLLSAPSRPQTSRPSLVPYLKAVNHQHKLGQRPSTVWLMHSASYIIIRQDKVHRPIARQSFSLVSQMVSGQRFTVTKSYKQTHTTYCTEIPFPFKSHNETSTSRNSQPFSYLRLPGIYHHCYLIQQSLLEKRWIKDSAWSERDRYLQLPRLVCTNVPFLTGASHSKFFINISVRRRRYPSGARP